MVNDFDASNVGGDDERRCSCTGLGLGRSIDKSLSRAGSDESDDKDTTNAVVIVSPNVPFTNAFIARTRRRGFGRRLRI